MMVEMVGRNVMSTGSRWAMTLKHSAIAILWYAFELFPCQLVIAPTYLIKDIEMN